MKKYLSILVCFLILSQCNQVQQPNLETKDAIVIITTKVKNGMMSDLVDFMDSENVLPITKKFKGCNDVVQFVNEENNIHVLLERWDNAESHQNYVKWRMNEDKSGAAAKHVTFAEGGAEGITILGNNSNYIYY